MIHLLTNRYEVIDPYFGRAPCEIELDLGCGKGAFALELARRYPSRLILGADVMLGRMRRFAKKIDRFGYTNIEALRAESFELVGYQLPDNCISRVHILCPDPWPKSRHRHRRLITTDFLTRIARILSTGGILHLATDHVPYLEMQRRLVRQLPFFHPEQQSIEDVREIKTEFEQQWEKEGRIVTHLGFRFNP